MKLIENVVLIIILSAAVFKDFQTDKIPNRLIFTGLITGLIFSYLIRGFPGLADGLAGCLLPALLLFILHVLSMLGAGDIKLFMTAGAFLGARGSLLSITAAFFTGAVLSLTLMIKNRNLYNRLHYFMQYLKQLTFIHHSYPYYDLKQPRAQETIHFSLCIAIGSVISMLFL